MRQIKVRGIRGANTVDGDSKSEIFRSTKDLLQEIFTVNRINPEEIAAIYFTLTPDLNAAFPAEVTREMGMTKVPLLCMREIGVPGSLPQVVRILLLVNTELDQNEIKHVYLREAKNLRDDLD
ncbi:MAG TPA: chorismate mutase [Bacteroidetes bacterium]|nr:chorismate mutase [Bacteroidota bacterium]